MSQDPAPSPPDHAPEPAPARASGLGFNLALAAIVILSIAGMVAIFVAGRAEPPERIPADAGPPASASRR